MARRWTTSTTRGEIGSDEKDKRMKITELSKFLVGLMLVPLFAGPPAHAVYNANMSGVVTDVLTYADGNVVLIRLNNQPASHPACNAMLIAIDHTVTADRRKLMMARLMLALANKESINIGYDATGECADTYIRVHRVG
jgi:hypothetical protein